MGILEIPHQDSLAPEPTERGHEGVPVAGGPVLQQLRQEGAVGQWTAEMPGTVRGPDWEACEIN